MALLSLIWTPFIWVPCSSERIDRRKGLDKGRRAIDLSHSAQEKEDVFVQHVNLSGRSRRNKPLSVLEQLVGNVCASEPALQRGGDQKVRHQSGCVRRQISARHVDVHQL